LLNPILADIGDELEHRNGEDDARDEIVVQKMKSVRMHEIPPPECLSTSASGHVSANAGICGSVCGEEIAFTSTATPVSLLIPVFHFPMLISSPFAFIHTPVTASGLSRMDAIAPRGFAVGQRVGEGEGEG
jgi:hypothetical protein